MHHIRECIQKIQALNLQLENIKQRAINNPSLDYRCHNASLVPLCIRCLGSGHLGPNPELAEPFWFIGRHFVS